MVFECHIQCPRFIRTECNCSTIPFLSFNCAKSNERISMAENRPTKSAKETRVYLEIKCEPVSSGRIFGSVNFGREKLSNITDIELIIQSCPLLAVTLIKNSIINHTKLTELKIIAKESTTLPQNIFESQENLKTLVLQKNMFTTLPDYIFEHQINLENLFLHENQLTVLLENIFESQINLKELYLLGNKLSTLPETIFRNTHTICII